MPPRTERRLIEPTPTRVLYLNERLRNFRKLRGWTQEIAAGWWGCSTREWQRWEAGWDVAPPRALMKRIVEWARRACPENVKYVS